MIRRDFLKGLTALGATLGIPSLAESRPAPIPLRDTETVRVGEILSVGVKDVFLNGERVTATAFNVREGWVEVFDRDRTERFGYAYMETRFGKVTYTMGAES